MHTHTPTVRNMTSNIQAQLQQTQETHEDIWDIFTWKSFP